MFGIDVEDLKLYEEADSSFDLVTFLIRKRKEDFGFKGCGSFHLATKDYKLKKYVFNSLYRQSIFAQKGIYIHRFRQNKQKHPSSMANLVFGYHLS